MGCRSHLIHNTEEAHISDRDACHPRWRTCQSLYPTLLSSPGFTRCLESLSDCYLDCNWGPNHIHFRFPPLFLFGLSSYVCLLGAVRYHEDSRRCEVQLLRRGRGHSLCRRDFHGAGRDYRSVAKLHILERTNPDSPKGGSDGNICYRLWGCRVWGITNARNLGPIL